MTEHRPLPFRLPSGEGMYNRQVRLTWLARLYLWATHRLYNQFTWAYDVVSWVISLGQWSRWRRMALDHVPRMGAHMTGQRVLELGFGTGELLIEMAERGWRVCGLELSSAMHRVTAGKMRRRGVWAPRVRGCAQALPFTGGAFHALVATFPAGFILSRATFLEAARVLRNPDSAADHQGGRFIITGLFFETESPMVRGASRLVWGGAAGSIATICKQLAADAGLTVTVTADKAKWIRWPILILEKREVPDRTFRISGDDEWSEKLIPPGQRRHYGRDA